MKESLERLVDFMYGLSGRVNKRWSKITDKGTSKIVLMIKQKNIGGSGACFKLKVLPFLE